MREDEANRNSYQGSKQFSGPSKDESYNSSKDREESSKNFGKSYRNDDYYNRGTSQNSDRTSNQNYGSSYNQNYNSNDRGSSNMSENFGSPESFASPGNSRDLQWNNQGSNQWNNAPGRESGFGQSNPRDQSYGQQYSRPYAGPQERDFGRDPGRNSGRDPNYNSGYEVSQGQYNRGNESQHSTYGSAGFGSLGTGYQNYNVQNSSDRSEASPRNEGTGRQTPGSYYGRGPKSFKRSDERIKEEVSEVFMRHHEVDATDIEIEVKEGEVTLIGFVPERRMKYLAEDLAEKIMGVRDVTNNIRVKREDHSMMDTMNSEADRVDKKSSSVTSDTGKKSGSGSVNNPNH